MSGADRPNINININILTTDTSTYYFPVDYECIRLLILKSSQNLKFFPTVQPQALRGSAISTHELFGTDITESTEREREREARNRVRTTRKHPSVLYRETDL
jgi:hypothetical protein